MIRILHVVSSLEIGGGVQQLLLNYYKNLDKNSICFDFAVHDEKRGELEDTFKALNSNVFHVTPKKKSLFKNIKEINLIIKKGDYDVVHCHQNLSNFSTLFLAWIHYVPVRISHAHGNFNEKKTLLLIRNAFFKFLNRLFANYFFACSFQSGKWLHGNGWNLNNNIIMKNAINIKKFTYDKKVRDHYRKELNFLDKTILMHAGRFSEEKNHLFMLEIMNILARKDEQYILVFAGSGETEFEIKEFTKKKGLTNNVLFLGARNDVPELMNSADILLLPSKHEGFGIVAIEAQVSGLLVLASDSVPQDTKITENILYLPIDNPELWADKIIHTKINKRKTEIDSVLNSDYDISQQALHYQSWLYEKLNYRDGK